jgi:Amidohydrolase family
VNPAWLARDEKRRGSLTPGKIADLVVLDRDPIETPPAELADIRVVATMLGGRWVHGGPPFTSDLPGEPLHSSGVLTTVSTSSRAS